MGADTSQGSQWSWASSLGTRSEQELGWERGLGLLAPQSQEGPTYSGHSVILLTWGRVPGTPEQQI